jgi:TolB-like protein/Tfp pilus assembly protein PilF
MELLVFLSARSPDVASIEEIIESVWHGKPMTTGSVYNCLNELRQAFGDDKNNPEYIETIARKGYRIIAKVSFDGPGEGSVNKLLTGRNVFSLSNLFRVAILGALVAILAIFSAKSRLFSPAIDEALSPAPATVARSIAVLPFVDLSPESDQQHFAQGISEEILNSIASNPEMKVVGRTSSFKVHEQNLDLREIGQQLGVEYLLEGSVRREETHLRITAQLVKARDGFHVWSHVYDAEIGQVFEIQDKIAANVSRALEVAVLGGVQEVTSPVITNSLVDISAYDLFLLARARINSASLADLEEAVELLKQALEIEPDYAQAHAELSYAWKSLTNLHREAYPSPDWDVRDGLIMQHAEQAVELDPYLADAYFSRGAARGSLYVRTSEDISAAFADYEKAIDLNPNHARAHLWMAGWLQDQNHSWTRTLKSAQRAIELEPLWPFAQQFYVNLISEVPAYRQEKWSTVRRLKAIDEESRISEITSYSELLALNVEGRLAEAVIFAENVPDHVQEVLQFEAIYSASLYKLGAYREVLDRKLVRPMQLEIHFPGGADAGWPLSYSQACLPPGLELPPHQTALCAYEELLRGESSNALSILQNSLPATIEEMSEHSQWSYIFNDLRSPAITLATIHKLDGQNELALRYAAHEEKILLTESENGAIRSPKFSKTRARIHALRGEYEQAIDELENTIEMGELHFRTFMHPVFTEIRSHPRYQAMLGHWLSLINAERAKLGLNPLALNPDTTQGNLPFLIE